MKLPWVLLLLCLSAQIIIVETKYGPEPQGGAPPIQEIWVDYDPLCFINESNEIHFYLDFGLEHDPHGPSDTHAFLYWDECGDWMHHNRTRWTYLRELTRVYEDLPIGHQHFITQLQWEFHDRHGETIYNDWGEYKVSRTYFYLNITAPEGWRTAGWFYPFVFDNVQATREEYELPPWAYTDPFGNVITTRELPCGGVDDEELEFPTGRELLYALLGDHGFQVAIVLLIVCILMSRWAIKNLEKKDREQE